MNSLNELSSFVRFLPCRLYCFHALFTLTIQGTPSVRLCFPFFFIFLICPLAILTALRHSHVCADEEQIEARVLGMRWRCIAWSAVRYIEMSQAGVGGNYPLKSKALYFEITDGSSKPRKITFSSTIDRFAALLKICNDMALENGFELFIKNGSIATSATAQERIRVSTFEMR